MNTRGILLALALLSASRAWATQPIVIRPGQPAERDYLAEDHSALREIGYDPLCPYTRIADGAKMSYTYRFRPGKGAMAYLLVGVGSQFLISVSGDAGATYTQAAEMRACEQVGTRVFVDLTPFTRQSGEVLVRFEDRYKEDGWGALLSEILYYTDGPGPAARLLLDDGWQCAGKAYRPGDAVAAAGAVSFETAFVPPAEWRGHDLALYFPDFQGSPERVLLNGRPLTLKETWDCGRWADVSGALRPGAQNRLAVRLSPTGGQAGVWGPVRVGLRLPACAVPAEKRLAGRTWRPNHAYEPYTPEKLNFLAGNFLQCLYDSRCDLVAFSAGERMPIHFVHDTTRSLVAIAEEERHTPVVRLELARRLYRGVKRALLPGGECLFAFKQDSRPMDLRPLPGSPDLAPMYKLDTCGPVCAAGVRLPGPDGAWQAPAKWADAPVERTPTGWMLRRTWTDGDRTLAVRALYAPMDADRAPALEVRLDGKGPVRLSVSRLAEKGMWFTPGSWGPEALMLPDGRERLAKDAAFTVEKPAFRYLLVRGGNTGSYTFCNALLVMWDGGPRLVTAGKTAGGRYGALFSDVSLEYENRRPQTVRLVLLPFGGYPASLKTPRAIAENLLRTGRMGVGAMDPVNTTNSNGLGPNAIAAAAYLFQKYHLPEAAEAEALALRCIRATIAQDEAGTRTQHFYHLLEACRYLQLLGHHEFDGWARTWADRMAADQAPDGSWPWLNYQWRCQLGLLRAHEILGDEKYLQAFRKGLATIEYRDDKLLWKGKPADPGEDFQGALSIAAFGYLGDRDGVQRMIAFHRNYLDDRGVSACSDLNPYLLGFSARGLKLPAGPKLILGLDEFAEYDAAGTRRISRPTAYVVNPHHPLARRVSFALDQAD